MNPATSATTDEFLYRQEEDVIDKRHTLLLTSDDPTALVALYAAWRGDIALLGESVTEVSKVTAPTRVVLPLRRNHSAARRAVAEQTLLGLGGVPMGEVFMVVLQNPSGTFMALFAVPRGVQVDARVEATSTCAEERTRRMPPSA